MRLWLSHHYVVLGLVGLQGCALPAGPQVPAGSVVDWMTPTEQAVRASVALRGVRPEPEVLLAIREDPGALEGWVDAWLESPEFGETIRDLHAETLSTRMDSNTVYQFPNVGLLADRTSGEAHTAIMEEPLRLIEQIVMEDRPYPEIVTADHFVANEVVATVWGADWTAGGAEWQPTHHTDGRPHAGILSSGWLWVRHKSAAFNFHRGRAALLTKALLCDDIATRDIVVGEGVDLADPADIAHAVTDDPNCAACHLVIDPMAAYLWGFKEQIQGSSIANAHAMDCPQDGMDPDGFAQDHPVHDYCYPLRQYTPAHEQDWWVQGLRPPGYYGQVGGDLSDLGRSIAADPRFHSCTVRRFHAWFTQTEIDAVDPDELDGLLQVYEDSGYSARELVRAIALSPHFLARPGGFSPSVDPLQTRPEQLARTVEALTGFRWTATPQAGAGCGKLCWGEVDLLRSDLFGFRTLAGGSDAYGVMQPYLEPSVTRTLVIERLSFAAAAYGVDTDLALPAEQRRLLTGIEREDRAEDRVRDQLVSLHARITSELLEPEDVDATWALWSATLERTNDTRQAWIVVVAALLQDPRVRWT